MAAADLAQALVCLHLAVRQRRQPPPPVDERAPGSPAAFLVKLGAVMLLLYFSAFLTRPFFALYWESVSGIESAITSGAVFAMPAGMALLALWYDRLRPASGSVVARILPAIGVALAGCLLQAIPHEAAVLAGRCVYGWGIVRAMVRLDVLLFQRSAPGAYATDFSKIHVFQQLGALIASTAAGSLVAARGLEAPLLAGGLGMLLTAGLYAGLFAALTRTARKVAMTS
jgi:MFS transporter, DHA1 family, multidrug resistance protein